MIIGEITAGARILLEKGPSRYHSSEDQQFAENTQKFLFFQIPEEDKRGGKGGPPWAHTMPWRGHLLGRAATWCGGPGPPHPVPLRVLHTTETLRHREPSRKYSAASTRRKNHRERKALRQGEICRGNSFPEGGNRRHRPRHCHGLHRKHQIGRAHV